MRFFLLGLSVGLVPLCVFVALEMLTSGPGGWMEQSEIVGSFIVPGIRILLLTIPVSTGYALIVDEVLDLSVVLAKTWRYLFGKWVITFATVIPVLVTILYLGLMAGPLAVLYGLLVCFGVVAPFLSPAMDRKTGHAISSITSSYSQFSFRIRLSPYLRQKVLKAFVTRQFSNWKMHYSQNMFGCMFLIRDSAASGTFQIALIFCEKKTN